MEKLHYFGHLMQRASSLGKTLMLEKIEGKRRRQWQRVKWLDSSTNSMYMNPSKLQEIVKACLAAVHEVAKSQTRLSDWTATTTRSFLGGWMWVRNVVVSQSCLTLCETMDCSMPGFPILHLEFAQTHVQRVSDAIQPSHPLSLPSPSALNLSQYQGLFHWVGSSHQVAKDWSFSFSIGPFNEYSGLISFRMDWLDLLAVQGTLKSLLQHHSSKVSILWCSAFFIIQLSSHTWLLEKP